MIRLDGRLSAAASLVRPGRRICDVGTDHALLPCFLWQNGERDIIACDINEKPLAAARENIEKFGCFGIRTVLSDGLDAVPPRDDIVIAGMGGELIADIVLRCGFVTEDTRFILQPMTKAEILRGRLYENGFEIMLEKGVCDAGKAYTVLLVRYTGEKREISEEFAFFGKCEDKGYTESVNKRLRKLAMGDPRFLTLIRETKD